MNPEEEANKQTRRKPLSVFGRQFHMPQSKGARVAIGVGLIFLGFFGLLPVLGFWMIPLGLFVLSQEFGWIRRMRRRLAVRWGRRRQGPLP